MTGSGRRASSSGPAPLYRLALIEILFLCTGNICRSPVAHGLLRHRLREAGIDAHVSSAGLLGPGNPAAAEGVEILSQLGLDISDHRSQRMSRELLDEADLVVAMAREHVREAVVLVPAAWPRTFTLKELVRRGSAVGARRPGESLVEWLAKVHAGRSTRELMGRSSDDDVADPIGRPRAVYVDMVDELESLIDQMVVLVWGRAALVPQVGVRGGGGDV